MQSHLFGHAELAKLVVELESTNPPIKPNMHLGQKGEGKAHTEIGSEEGLNLTQKETEQTSGRANESEGDDEQRHEGNPEALCRMEAGSGSESRHIEPNSNQEGRLTVERKNQEGVNAHGLSEEEVAEVGTASKTQPRKQKALRELGDANTFPRRSIRLSEKIFQKKNDLVNREGMFSASISDGDILLCNARVHSPESREESDNLWAVGKRFGLAYRGEEDEVVQEFIIMEDRDQEVKNNAE